MVDIRWRYRHYARKSPSSGSAPRVIELCLCIPRPGEKKKGKHCSLILIWLENMGRRAVCLLVWVWSGVDAPASIGPRVACL